MEGTDGQAKLLIVTRPALRHRLLLGLAERELGSYWTRTLIQGEREDFDAVPPPARPDRRPHPGRWIRRLLARRRARDALARVAEHAYERPLEECLLDPPAALAPRVDVQERVRELLAPIEPLPAERLPDAKFSPDPNTDDVFRWLEADPPDLILVFGGKILRGPWLTAARLGALNLHYGYLPYYRSSWSTQFAVFQDRLDRVGPTIHYIDAGVDTGPIVARVPVAATPPIELEELIARVYSAGIRELVRCGRAALAEGRVLPAEAKQAPNSYYPSAVASPLIERIARIRLGRPALDWPAVQRRVEARAGTAREALAARPRDPEEPFPAGAYVFLYHSVVDPGNAAEWETAYRKVAVSSTRFREHLEFLRTRMQPVALSELPSLLATGTVDRAYFAVTFDDAYRNVMTHARAVVDALGVRPTLFVSRDFAEGRPYYRVLASLLVERGHARALREELLHRLPDVGWSSDPEVLFGQTKSLYVPRQMETAVEAVYRRCLGDPAALRVHLDADEIRRLQQAGWEIGNHTASHQPLHALSGQAVAEAIDSNAEYWTAMGVPLIDWLSYPNGRAADVRPEVKEWLDRHPDCHGIFAAGGVNLIPSRTEWLRIGVGDWDLPTLDRQIRESVVATKLAFSDVFAESRCDTATARR